MSMMISGTFVSTYSQIGTSIFAVSDTTLSAPATSISATSLDLDTAGTYSFFCSGTQISAGAQTMDLRCNDDNTTSNYWVNYLQQTGGAVTGNRVNDCEIGSISDANHPFVIYGVLFKNPINSKPVAYIEGCYSSDMLLQKRGWWEHDTSANITKLTFLCGGQMNTGTRLLIWKSRPS